MIPPSSAQSPRAQGGRLDGVRIAVVNFREPRQSVAGGAEEYAWQVGRQLVARGADVDFVTSREPGQVTQENRDGIRLRRMGNRFTVYALVPLWLLLHRRTYDVVLDCMNGVPFFTPVVTSRRVAVICVVHHVHDQQFYAFFPSWLARFGCFLEGPVARRLYRNCVTVTGSASSRNSLRAKLRWVAPIQVIPYGAPSTPSSRPARPPAEGDPAIVYVGRLAAAKRVDRVIELADRLRDRWPGLHVHIVGRGEQYESLTAQVEALDLRDRVHMHGFLSDADKDNLLATARLHVTASEFEGWGLTVTEAAALGVPTVGYEVDGLCDSVRHGVTGWLVREDEDLADVVDRSLKELSDPVFRYETRMSCQAWAGRFTWARTGTEMATLISGELARQGAKTAEIRQSMSVSSPSPSVMRAGAPIKAVDVPETR